VAQQKSDEIKSSLETACSIHVRVGPIFPHVAGDVQNDLQRDREIVLTRYAVFSRPTHSLSLSRMALYGVVCVELVFAAIAAWQIIDVLYSLRFYPYAVFRFVNNTRVGCRELMFQFENLESVVFLTRFVHVRV